MRNRMTADSLQVHAVAGSSVELPGISLPRQAAKRLPGFVAGRTGPATFADGMDGARAVTPPGLPGTRCCGPPLSRGRV